MSGFRFGRLTYLLLLPAALVCTSRPAIKTAPEAARAGLLLPRTGAVASLGTSAAAIPDTTRPARRASSQSSSGLYNRLHNKESARSLAASESQPALRPGVVRPAAFFSGSSRSPAFDARDPAGAGAGNPGDAAAGAGDKRANDFFRGRAAGVFLGWNYFWIAAVVLALVVVGVVLLLWYRRRRRKTPVFLGADWANHPRFMMVGGDGSGKSAVLQSLARNLPRSGSGPDHISQGSYTWWFYDEAVILDPDGSLVLDKGGRGSNDADWLNLLRSLRNDRPDRPLDGIILNVSLEDLREDDGLAGTEAGEAMLDPSTGPGAPTLEEKARSRAIVLKDKLKSLEKILGMRLPVYLLISKTDMVPGFQSLCESLPAHLQHSTLGWSNPYSLDSLHGPDRTAEVLQELNRRLHFLQMERFAEEQPVSGAEDFFLLANQLQPALRALGIYLNILFRESIHRESFFFRGLYFTGRRQVAGPVRTTGIEQRIAFSKDLFARKIFPEWTLARPIQRTLLSRNRTVFWIQVGILVFTLLGGIGLYRDYHELKESREPIRNAILQVAQGLRRLPYSSGVFNEFAGDLFRDMARIPRDNLVFAFIPTSWISSIDDEVVHVFREGYHHLIVRALRAGLMQRTAALLDCYRPNSKATVGSHPSCDLPLAPLKSATGRPVTEESLKESAGALAGKVKLPKKLPKNPKAALGQARKAGKQAGKKAAKDAQKEAHKDAGKQNAEPTRPTVEPPAPGPRAVVVPVIPEKSPAFERLTHFARALELLEVNIARFNQLQEQGEDDLVQLKLLANYLGYDIPVSFLESEDLYREALKEAEGRKIPWTIVVFTWDDSLREHLSEENARSIRSLGRVFKNRRMFLKKVRRALASVGDPESDLGEEEIDSLKDIRSQLLARTVTFKGGASVVAQGLVADIYEEQISKGMIRPLSQVPDLDSLQTSGDPTEERHKLNDAVLSAHKALEELNPIWIRGGVFTAYPDFDGTLNRLSAQEIAGPIVASTVRRAYERNRLSHRKLLKGFRLWNAVPVMAVENPNDAHSALASPLQFSGCMAAFHEAAVERKPERELPPSVRPFARLIWKAPVLKKAGKFFTEHEEFIGRELDRCPAEARFMLRRLAESNLRVRVLNKVAEAIVYEPFPRRRADLLTEKEIAREAKSLAAAGQDLEAVLSLLDNLDDDTLFNLILSQADRLFRSLDVLVTRVGYVPGREYFARWDGQQSLTFTVYDLDGEPEIEAFLKIQRAEMSKLAGHAAPAAELLKYRVHRPENRELRKKLRSYRSWAKIIDSLDRYESRTPGNPVATLEKFIMFEMDEITGSNCYQRTADRNRYADDFFLERMGIIKRYIYGRCEKLFVN